MPQKPDWPPLLPQGGLLNISRSGLLAMAVEPFVKPQRREELTAKLFLWMDEFAVLGVALTVWVDGSYSTMKEEPADIDICALLTDKSLQALDNDRYARASQLLDRSYVKAGYELDLYVVDADDAREQGAWKELFGKGHDRVTVKGLFAMKAQE